MRMAQKYGCVALAALAVGVGCMTPAEAAYNPKLKSKLSGASSKEVQGVVSYLKSLPKSVRWAFMAERLGVLFIPPSGRSGHNENDQGWILEGSHFIGADGVDYDALTEYNSYENRDEWNANSEKTDRLGREYVFAKLSREVTALVLKNAKYQLDKMAEEQPERRDMYLAYLAKLCYLPDGKSANEQEITRIGPHKKPINFCDYDDKGYKFVDTEGAEHDFDEVNKKAASLGGERWMILNVCAHHVGKKDILALFPEEVKKLRANYKKRMKELQDGSTEAQQPAENKTSNSKQEKTNEKQAAAVPTILAKKVGANYQPVDMSKDGEENEETIRSVVEYLRGLSNSLRWGFIAEKLGLLFMPKDGSFGQYDNSWAKPGAHFIGADGMEYDCESELRTRSQEGKDAWGDNLNKIGQLGKDVVFVRLSDEVAELVLQNTKYHLDKWAVERPEQRELFLAYLAGLCYMPNGANAYGEETQRKWYNLRPIKYTSLEPHCRFMDTAGVEQRNEAINKKYDGGNRWMLLTACANYVGKDAILALYPKEVKALRANYKKRMAEIDQAKKEIPLTLSKSIGAKYLPQGSSDRMGGQFMKNVQEVVTFLQSLPNTQRWFFIAERMGLLFMPKDGATGYNPGHGWAMEHAHFIGADGVDYEYNDIIQDAPSTWVSNSDAAERLGGRAVVFSQLPDETAEILLQNAKYQIDILEKDLPVAKDAMLAQLAQLGYSSGGKLSYKLRRWNTGNTLFEEYLPDIADTNEIRFVDRNGKEQFHVKDAYSKIAGGRWQIVMICAYHLGSEAILALYPDDVKKLRANYEKRMAELKK